MTMFFDEYQAETQKTAGEFDSATESLVSYALGIAGEAGEFANLVKKGVYHGHGLAVEKLVEEAGDILWYLARAMAVLNVSLDQVAEKNLAKLQRRYPDGFSYEASRNRKE